MGFSPGVLIRGVLTKLSKSNDLKTTIIGAVIVAVLAADNIDFNQILLGNKVALTNLVVIILLAAFAFFTNKGDKKEGDKQ